MKLIIAGPRKFEDYDTLLFAVESSPFSHITEVVCGCAPGADRLGHRWAREVGIPVIFMPGWAYQTTWAKQNIHLGEILLADFDEYGNHAGMLRNAQMGDYADAAVVIDAGTSGSSHMIQKMKDRSKPYLAYKVSKFMLQRGNP